MHRLTGILALAGFALLLSGLSKAAAPETADRIPEKFPKLIEGKVVGIEDGDTVTVLDDNRRSFRIRLAGIDAPEKGQDYGKRSKQAVSEKIFGERVRVHWKETDRYRRELGHIFLGDRWINKEMVRDGWAWHYKKYSDDPELAQSEITARKQRAGLWAQPNEPVAPWDYRSRWRRPRTKVAERPAESPAGERRYWLNTSSNVRHNSQCKYFKNTKRGRVCKPDEGRHCGICGG